MLLRIFYTVVIINFLVLGVGGWPDKRSDNAPSTCEEVRHAYDEAIAHSQKSSESKVIVIFREGKNETKKGLIKLRMKALSQHIKFRGSPFERFVLATGEKAPELGTLEIYIEGRLEWQLFAAPNALFGDDCTEGSK